jgi:hypothetical protein
MPSHLALFALMLSPSSLIRTHVNQDRTHIGAWTLRVHLDQFTGRRTCTLSEHRIEYRRNALVFHFSHRTDTASAAYRIDGGQPIWVRTDAMELARLGFSLHFDDLSNPSGGIVRVPLSRIQEARVVDIQAVPGGLATTFRLDGFKAAVAAAHVAGCGADDFD